MFVDLIGDLLLANHFSYRISNDFTPYPDYKLVKRMFRPGFHHRSLPISEYGPRILEPGLAEYNTVLVQVVRGNCGCAMYF